MEKVETLKLKSINCMAEIEPLEHHQIVYKRRGIRTGIKDNRSHCNGRAA